MRADASKRSRKKGKVDDMSKIRQRAAHILSSWRLGLLALWFAACHGNRLELTGTAVRHEHHPAYTTFVTICSGKPMMCHISPIYHPERWVVVVHVGQEDVSIDTDATTYARTQDAREVRVTYETGACGGYSLRGPASIRSALDP
jgi:hypothetical protein